MNQHRLGNRIRYYRMKKGVTVKDFAQEIDIPKSSLSTIENGEVKPSVETFVKIANALGVDFDALLCDSVFKDIDLLEKEILTELSLVKQPEFYKSVIEYTEQFLQARGENNGV